MGCREFIDSAVERLAGIYPADEARAAAIQLICRFAGLQRYKVLASPELPLDEAAEPLEEALLQMEQGRPLQYVLGFTEFFGLKIRVSEGVLIPRPETEEMVSLIVESMTSEGIPSGSNGVFNILDICTGSGCIAYALADAIPGAQVFACDISDAALAVACRQRVKLPGARPVFFRADVLEAPPAGLPKFDLIVSNPPYVMESEKALMRRNVLDYEPAEALFVPDDDPLRFYAAIRRWAGVLLAPKGEIWLEINESLGSATAALFGPAAELLQDISGRDRFLHIL